MKIFELLEARSNPALNKKTITLDALEQIYNQHRGQDLYLSFTSINKLGINPSSIYKTPNGIYAYPLEYVLDNYNTIPFAAESEFAHVFLCNGKVFNIYNAASDEIGSIRQKVDQMYNLSDDEDAQNNFKIYQARSKIEAQAGAAAWWYIYYVAKRFADNTIPKQYNKKDEQIRYPVALLSAEIWRKLGYDGVVDKGTKTIHQNEPTQAVFFSLSHLQHISTLLNKINDTDFNRGNRVMAADQHEHMDTWSDLSDKLNTGNIVARLPPAVEKRVFASGGNKQTRSYNDASTMVKYANRFLKGSRLPPNCEQVIAQDDMSTWAYTATRGMALRRELEQLRKDDDDGL